MDWTQTWPAAWKVILFATLPILELRGAIPYALFVEKMPWPRAYLLSVIGNMIPVLPILLFLGPAERWLGKYRLWRRFFDWLFARTRRRGKLIDRYKVLGLVLFVGIPLPVTGAWTGCAAAHVFGVPLRKSLPAVTLGVLMAGVVVTLACKAGFAVGLFFRQM